MRNSVVAGPPDRQFVQIASERRSGRGSADGSVVVEPGLCLHAALTLAGHRNIGQIAPERHFGGEFADRSADMRERGQLLHA